MNIVRVYMAIKPGILIPGVSNHWGLCIAGCESTQISTKSIQLIEGSFPQHEFSFSAVQHSYVSCHQKEMDHPNCISKWQKF